MFPFLYQRTVFQDEKYMFYQAFKKHIIPISYKMFQRIEIGKVAKLLCYQREQGQCNFTMSTDALILNFKNKSNSEVQSVLIICRFHIYELPYLSKCICNPKINTQSACTVIQKHVQSCKKFELPELVPSCGQTRQHSAFLFSLIYSKLVFILRPI